MDCGVNADVIVKQQLGVVAMWNVRVATTPSPHTDSEGGRSTVDDDYDEDPDPESRLEAALSVASSAFASPRAQQSRARTTWTPRSSYFDELVCTAHPSQPHASSTVLDAVGRERALRSELQTLRNARRRDAVTQKMLRGALQAALEAMESACLPIPQQSRALLSACDARVDSAACLCVPQLRMISATSVLQQTTAPTKLSTKRWPHALWPCSHNRAPLSPLVVKDREQTLNFKVVEDDTDTCECGSRDDRADEGVFVARLVYDDDSTTVAGSCLRVSCTEGVRADRPELRSEVWSKRCGDFVTFVVRSLTVLSSETTPVKHRKFRYDVFWRSERTDVVDVLRRVGGSVGFFVVSKIPTLPAHAQLSPALPRS